MLSQYWGWSESDFKRELSQQLLQQSVVAKLDTATTSKASQVLKQLRSGADFATQASQNSQDLLTKNNGGQYPNPITLNDQQISPIISHALFKLSPGQISGVVNTGFTLEILKVMDKSGNSLHGSHIQFNLQDVTKYTQPLETKQHVHRYIKV